MPDPITPATPEPTPQDAAPEQKGTAEKRINQLYARAKTAEEQVTTLQEQMDQLRTANLELQREMTIIRGSDRAPAAAPANPPAPVYDSGLSSTDGLVESLRKEIHDSVGSLRQELIQGRVREQILQNQRQMFGQAVQEFPELRDQNSRLFKLTDQIFRSDEELQRHPHGPYKAALMAKGLMGTEVAAEPTPQQKVAATVPVSTGPGTQSRESAEIQAARAEVERLKDDMQNQRGDAGKLWVAYRRAKIELGKLTGDNVGSVYPGGPTQ